MKKESIKRQLLVCLLVFAMLAGLMGVNEDWGDVTHAYTQPLVTNSGVVYPISLSTGKDAAGKLVFPDKNFFTYIKQGKFQTGGYSGYLFDLDENGFLSKEECELVRVLSVSARKDIKSIKGIEAFPKLRELYCSGTGIAEIDLSNNPRLQILTCSDNEITSLDVSACPILKTLQVSGCGLTSLNLSANTKLDFLTCMYQERTAYEYKDGSQYKVSLGDWDKNINLSKVSNVEIDGAAGDGVNSGYNAKNGTVYCSDEMQQISYQYDFSFSGVSGSSVDTVMNVTLNLKTGNREYYVTNGGSSVLAQYVEAGQKDKEPERPKKDGYRLTGWYKKPACGAEDRWSFGTALNGNVVLYAGWEKKNYKVYYDTKGGVPAVKERKGTVDWWTANLIPTGVSVPKKMGYNLAGWLTGSGKIITPKNAAGISYGQAVKNDEKDSTTLTAQWKAKTGYNLRFRKNLTDKLGRKVEDFPDDEMSGRIDWNSSDCVAWEDEPILAGYDFLGWYTAKSGGKKVTYKTLYSEIYTSQFKGDSAANIPTLYARFKRKTFTVYYKERGGSKVKDRTDIVWGSANLLPKKKTKRKNYIFAGWKCDDKRITKKTRINDICDGYDDFVYLKAFWYKKYEKKGKKFWRYGCRYQVTQSNKKGNKVRLIQVKKGKKKITIYDKVFFHGKNFRLKSIKKGALKRVKKVILKVPKKQKKKYRKMLRK